jgi:type IV fimbrial biogenesis protein FimT
MARMARLHPVCRVSRGVTLVEMIVVMALFAIIVGIAAPGLADFISGQRAKTVAFDLTSDLLLARSEALKRNRSVTIEPIGGDWRSGWSASVDDVEVLRRNEVGPGLSFEDIPASIRFNVFGRVASPAASVRMTVRADSGSDSSSRCVELDLAGRARVQRGACT